MGMDREFNAQRSSPRTPTQGCPRLRREWSDLSLPDDAAPDEHWATKRRSSFPFRPFVNVLTALVPHDRVIEFIMDEKGARMACFRDPGRTAQATCCASDWDRIILRMKRMDQMGGTAGRLAPGRICVHRPDGHRVCADIFGSIDEMGARGYVGMGVRGCAAPCGDNYVIIIEHPVSIIDASPRDTQGMGPLLECALE